MADEVIFSPLCDPCGERAEMMLSVANLVGKPLLIESVAAELCSLCENVLMHVVQDAELDLPPHQGVV